MPGNRKIAATRWFFSLCCAAACLVFCFLAAVALPHKSDAITVLFLAIPIAAFGLAAWLLCPATR